MDCTQTGCDCHGRVAGRPAPEPAVLARLEEVRRAQALLALADESERIAGGAMGFGGEGSWTSTACGLGLEGPVADDELDRLVAFYVSRGVTPRIEVCPFAHPSLVNGLCERGLVAQEYEAVLARSLGREDDLGEDLPDLRAQGLEVKLVDRQDPALVETFLRVWYAGLGLPDEPIPEAMERLVRRSVAHPDVDSLLVRVEGLPAGAATASYRGELACLAEASILPASRRIGLHQALIVRRLELARERGCTLAVIHAQPDSPAERHAALFGFRAMYTKVRMEREPPGPSPGG